MFVIHKHKKSIGIAPIASFQFEVTIHINLDIIATF
jgi:hypothetical protein